MLCALRTLAIREMRSKNSFCLAGSSAMARNSSKRAWRAFGSRSSRRILLQDRLLLHELNVERASSSRVAIEQIVAGLLGNYLVQGIDQFHGIMNAAIQSQTTDGVVHMRRIAGEKDTAFAKHARQRAGARCKDYDARRCSADQGKYPLQARIGRFIAQCFFVALFHPRRNTARHRPSSPAT